ncbi:hydrogenase maturation protease [Mycobacterium sp. shizuoka-1]|uniref:hydrogenase maturation protease n=1 Tax=Mycobacterium sp. shizuoka-1 TaxID=2039281 RepID=UPI000C05FF5D|nr:hydrogenase maturation protease [Mycobacterium sp. shizuoka-1]GAY16332.1 peptidase M52 [Mycobacterium sp. shizuoka-1]
MSVVVIGVGNDLRRDDGVGPTVAAEVARNCPPGVRVLTCDAEPAALLDAWEHAALAVVIDAAAGDRPGRVRRVDLHEVDDTVAVSSHDLSLLTTFRLAQALGRAPQAAVAVTVDAGDLGHGAGLSAAVAAAVPAAAAAVLREIAG